MTEASERDTANAELAALLTRADALEKQLSEVQLQSAARLVQSELKAEALRAGMIDLDGLKLIDPAVLAPGQDGEFHDAAIVIAQLRRSKPWLFGAANSSSVALTPTATATRRKLATEMSLDEWRSARADLLRKR